jgi:hypothetical protein
MIDKAVEKMDKKRVRLMASLFMEMGQQADQARQSVELQYAACLGVQSYCVNRSRAADRKLFGQFAVLLRSGMQNPEELPV